MNPDSPLPSNYAPLLEELKGRVRSARVRAAVSVNSELIQLYWHIGRGILEAQKSEGWGSKVVDRLARDLGKSFPGMKGFSPLNLKRMRAFYVAWATRDGDDPAIVSQAVTQLDSPPDPVSKLAWGANLALLHKLKDPDTRLWYAGKAVENGWSRAVLTVQIESQLYERSGKAANNFSKTLPPGQSDMAKESLKDPYLFDFLNLGEEALERDLEQGLVGHVQHLLLEMGTGFAFVGRQTRLEVGDEDFYLDLLFYHLRLRCYVVVDLKMKPFQPEFAGKMNFYLSAVDDQLRHPDDAPTIGLLLCKDASNRLKVEYALRDMDKPIGVAGWQAKLVGQLPSDLEGTLPTIEQFERELSGADSCK